MPDYKFLTTTTSYSHEGNVTTAGMTTLDSNSTVDLAETSERID